MPFHCPECSKNIDTAVQASLKERLDRETAKLTAKDTELELTRKKLEQAQSSAKSWETERAELVELRKAKSRADRQEVLRKNGIPEDALDDIATLYDARMGQREEDKRVSFEDFLGAEGEARSMVLLKGYFDAASTSGDSAASSVADAGGGAASSGGTGSVGSSNGGATSQRVDGRKASAADVQRYLASPAYRNLSKEDQAKKLDELEARYSGGSNSDPAIA